MDASCASCCCSCIPARSDAWSAKARAPRTLPSPSAAPAAACALVFVLLVLVSSSASPSLSLRSTCRLAATSCSRPTTALFSDPDSATARVSHELADLPGDDGESRSLSRRRFADGAEGAEPTRAPAASTRRSVLLKRFFTWLSVLPGMPREMTAHLLPYTACAARIFLSSSSVNGPRFTEGLSWLHHLRGRNNEIRNNGAGWLERQRDARGRGGSARVAVEDQARKCASPAMRGRRTRARRARGDSRGVERPRTRSGARAP
mmetsp:Transcript_1882/g.7838  ORF Transcript_1882/g.7838 Transcript_1882/m.7838 type:complete len:262 (+) Transcript_1882:555-1340(+)